MDATLTGQRDYLPWPELRHAASVLRKIAAEYPRGSTYTIMAALVVAAFSVEAFVQTLGPQVLKEGWTEGKWPMERWSVKDKLKAIGKTVGVAVDYGKSPWSDIKSLLEARDDLAHAKPATQLVTSTINVPPDGKLPPDLIGPLVAQKFRPLHDLAELERVAKLIDEALLPMWTSAGNPAATFSMHGTSSYVVSM